MSYIALQLRYYRHHAALNLGLAARHIRYLFSYPDGKHHLKAPLLRTAWVINDLFFALLPPQSHHSQKDLKIMQKGSIFSWFKEGWLDQDLHI